MPEHEWREWAIARRRIGAYCVVITRAVTTRYDKRRYVYLGTVTAS
ncbi:hypothetical protein [Streptomyces sp. NPDC004546]